MAQSSMVVVDITSDVVDINRQSSQVGDGFTLSGYKYINILEQESIRTHYAVLDAIAKMKIDQLIAWRYERLADARMNSSGLIQTLLLEWLQTRKPKVLKEITARMEVFRENEGYHNMILTDSRGNVLISLIDKSDYSMSEKNLNQQHKQHLQAEEDLLLGQVLASQQPTLGDFYFCYTCKKTILSSALRLWIKIKQ